MSAAERPVSNMVAKTFLPTAPVILLGFHQRDKFRQSGRRHRAIGDLFAGIVQAAKEFRLHPVGGRFAGCAGFHYGFEIDSPKPACLSKLPHHMA